MGLYFKLTVVSLLISSVELVRMPKCLTGYMTDVQHWVDEDGKLTQAVEYQNAIDLSSHINPLPVLQQKVSVFRFSSGQVIKYLSLARCRLSRIPPVFHIIDSSGRALYDMVEYVTFYGNIFMDISVPGERYDVIFNATEARNSAIGFTSEVSTSVWSAGFQQIKFPRLKELDLRACGIRILSESLFIGMPELESLYLGENNIYFIDADAFKGLDKLIHLDLSHNVAYDDRGIVKQIVIESFRVFEHLKNLSSLDFSYTKITQRNLGVLNGLGKPMQRLSLCEAGLRNLRFNAFNETSLRILDLSYNDDGVLSFKDSLDGLQATLQFLYAKDVGLNSIDIFKGFNKLEVLSLSGNEINAIPNDVAKTLTNLQILDLSKNRFTTWFEPKFSLIPELKFLSLTNNNINLISEEMLEDLSNISFLAISRNFLVCNCHSRDLIELAATNENNFYNTPIKALNSFIIDPIISYHRGFKDFNKQIFGRMKVEIHSVENSEDIDNITIDSKFLLVDYTPLLYTCLSVPLSKVVPFTEITGCRTTKNLDYDEVMQGGAKKILILLVIPCIMVPVMIGFIFRKTFRYCFITMRNSAMLSLIKDKENIDGTIPEGTIFYYDVFVSYCNEDREWVLDHLLPHLESDYNVSACLHERDFQVGLTILENIVACMDRSRTIMLIISQRFLKSQWCQFEMHLAQHRLLETRREDLTLVLLEEIPRRLRPTTLHYFMLTKTYIVWPEAEGERGLFWKRLKKSFNSQKLKQRPAVSVA
ncbi:hypothetical protein K1T71_000943 [Dendrolimus kikuchii]|uniref:Uncharacterized protein n=1 Tax=Dendrolimus kikuchii TaxID=765133 RepID=A0ACC1DH68_9NEOP|nr:hypothetical protein K1T71_000943 [Dendrolimus kikuchii]